jgi:hypothetical protein
VYENKDSFSLNKGASKYEWDSDTRSGKAADDFIGKKMKPKYFQLMH